VIYQLRNLTTYRYQTPVTFARCVLRLTPRDGAEQTVLESVITITPKPSRTREHLGPFGERVLTATLDIPHRELKIDARSRVLVRRPARLEPLGGPSWEWVRMEAVSAASIEAASPVHFLYPTAMTPLASAITDYARDCFSPGRPVVEAVFALTCRIRYDFRYDPEATDVRTPAVEAFKARHGVCQDFSHIMICALRGLGLPAAYVSGYLRTTPPPGRPRLEGADATHAWVGVWCGDEHGWIGFDPTNALVVGADHVVLAMGRDYADVTPIDGVILGSGKQSLKVAVDVVPMEGAATDTQPARPG
jgi:transglutaminase-like putative cysteine protease